MKQFDFNLFFDYKRLDAKLKNFFKDDAVCLQSIKDYKTQGFKDEGLHFIERYIDVVNAVVSVYEVKSYLDKNSEEGVSE